ncbi:hypothetical protein PIB30_032164 [Stylosanthes scabra]|uniref:Transposase (putative) gypsy type domain-containing protein n=1 Tax=Stylosanthes scabra TaxID=79078 RepID=A0ABU6ZC28_9FABA|nr:hypothetical protein [Stylosanthes scabra]
MAENQPENQEAVVPAAGVAQIPRELSPIYRWVSRDVLGASPILSQAYLDELKLSGVIFGGGELEGRYRVEATRPGDRVCYLNLDHPTVPNWLWVNEVMFTEFGVRVPFTDFQQRLLNRVSVAPFQLHPNAWLAIRCFELVTDSLRLPQDPEVFLYLFTLFSPNTEGKTKKGYMSVHPGKHRKIFGLYEDSFHDLKGRFFKIFPVGEHRHFWLSLEGQGRFPPYWSRDAGMDYVPVTYKGLNSDQKDTADILLIWPGRRLPLVAEQARVKAEGDLKSLSGKLEVLEREKVQEAERRKNWESELEGEIWDLRKSVFNEKARADKAKASLAESERSHDEVVRMAEDSVVATERALKDQISLLLPDFDFSQLGAFKVIVDGKIVDLPE